MAEASTLSNRCLGVTVSTHATRRRRTAAHSPKAMKDKRIAMNGARVRACHCCGSVNSGYDART